jgi:hypothetical protein
VTTLGAASRLRPYSKKIYEPTVFAAVGAAQFLSKIGYGLRQQYDAAGLEPRSPELQAAVDRMQQREAA